MPCFWKNYSAFWSGMIKAHIPVKLCIRFPSNVATFTASVKSCCQQRLAWWLVTSGHLLDNIGERNSEPERLLRMCLQNRLSLIRWHSSCRQLSFGLVTVCKISRDDIDQENGSTVMYSLAQINYLCWVSCNQSFTDLILLPCLQAVFVYFLYSSIILDLIWCV